MNHTPGPWAIETSSFWTRTHVITAIDGKVAVAQARFAGLSETFEAAPEESMAANAKLIAASPDLLSALIMAKNWMECEKDNRHYMTEHDRAVYDESMAAINNAIKKATS